jgi:MFS family permease
MAGVIAPALPAAEARNHPLAIRMAVIAFLVQNISAACVFGSFSVLLAPVEARLEIGRDLSTFAVPLAILATAACAPVIGTLASRHSLRLIMLVGAVLGVAGFALLAVTASYPIYLATYGLLLGPSMAVGAVLPATLVTRWFLAGRGRALGIVCTPVVIAATPLLTDWVVRSFGVPATYGTLALMSAVMIVAALFVVDHPPGAPAAAAGTQTAAKSDVGMAALLRVGRFWALMLGYAASITGSIILTSQMVPMADSWGYAQTDGALLLSLQSTAGIAGPLLFGWIADRLGGALALLILVLDSALLWAFLVLHPNYDATAVNVALIGLHGSAAVPVVGVALSEAFGRDGFSRAYGLLNLLNLPFIVLCVPAAGLVFSRTGSYTGALIGELSFLALAGLLLLLANRGRSA